MLVGALVALPPPLCRGKTGHYDPRLNRTPKARAMAEIKAAYDALCPLVAESKDCGGGDVFENPGIGQNALTWVSGVGLGKNTRSLIVYSASFRNALDTSFGPGASFGVLAHEVGHTLTAAGGLRKQFDSSWDEELRADWFAGCALGRSGRSAAELEAALRALAEVATASHPSFQHRGPAVRSGFHECEKLQREADRAAAREKPAFGIGSMLRAQRDDRPCWGYWYRSKTEIAKLGPIAAKRRRSRAYKSKKACIKARSKASDHEPERCNCQ